jgi:hypothetical protein
MNHCVKKSEFERPLYSFNDKIKKTCNLEGSEIPFGCSQI